MNRISRRTVLGTALGSFLCAAPALAQGSWPTRPIRIVVPSAAGGYDVYVRMIAPMLAEQLGQPVVVDNRPGANGNIGMAEVGKSTPDGHTLLFVATGALTVNPNVFKTMPLDTVADLEQIAIPVTVPMIWVTHPESRFKSLKDIVEIARAEPGKIDYANPGSGSLNHLLVEAFKQRHGLDIVPIPFNGTPPAQNEVAAGRIPFMVDSVGAGWALITSNRVRPLAVTTRERAKVLPDVPTVMELGLDEREYIGWYGFLAPKGTPADAIARINAAINKAIADPKITERVIQLGAQPQQSTPEDLRKVMITDRNVWEKVARNAGLEPN